jgi:hypothetical protein
VIEVGAGGANLGGALAITSSSALTVQDGDTLTFADGSTITNDGTMTFDASATLAIPGGGFGNPAVTLDGSGALVVDGAAIQGGYNSTLDNNSTIEGSGEIGTNVGLALNNTGTIDADQSKPLTVQLDTGYPTTNTGTLEATDGGTLQLQGVINNTNGVIEAVGAGSVVLLVGNLTSNATQATLSGGTLGTSKGGAIEVGSGGATFSGGLTVTAGSTLTVLDGDSLTMASSTFTITNNGTITFDSASELLLGSDTVTLKGSGVLELNGGTIYDGYNATLYNASTIEGSGAIGANIGLTLNNSGAIDANQSAPLDLLNSAGNTVNNTGTLEATNGWKLIVDSALSGAGSLQIGASSEIELGVATGETATFAGSANAKLRLDTRSSYTGTIAVFAPGDVLELANTNVASLGLPTLNGSGNTVLTANLNGGGALSYTFVGDLTKDGFVVNHVGSDSDILVGLSGQMTLAAATEGVALPATTRVATFSDANANDTASTFSATIEWGDGATTAGTVTGSNGSFTVEAGHTYADEGSDPLRVAITHEPNGAVLNLSGNVAVAEGDSLTPNG